MYSADETHANKNSYASNLTLAEIHVIISPITVDATSSQCNAETYTTCRGLMSKKS